VYAPKLKRMNGSVYSLSHPSMPMGSKANRHHKWCPPISDVTADGCENDSSNQHANVSKVHREAEAEVEVARAFISEQEGIQQRLCEAIQLANTNLEMKSSEATAAKLSQLLYKSRCFINSLKTEMNRVIAHSEGHQLGRHERPTASDWLTPSFKDPSPGPPESTQTLQLRRYQEIGACWMMSLHDNGLNGILADEMGLGKTTQVLAFLVELQKLHNVWGPHLIVVPLSVISSWQTEISKFFAGQFDVHLHYGTHAERTEAFNIWSKKQFRRYRDHKAQVIHSKQSSPAAIQSTRVSIMLTSYEICQRDISLFRKLGGVAGNGGGGGGGGVGCSDSPANRESLQWYHMIIDEAHRLKNKRSFSFHNMNTIKSYFRLLLTGTPIHNNLAELWTLLSFILPDLFSDPQLLALWFNRPFEELPKTTEDSFVEETSISYKDDDVCSGLFKSALTPQRTSQQTSLLHIQPSASCDSLSSAGADMHQRSGRNDTIRVGSPFKWIRNASTLLSNVDKDLIIRTLHQVIEPFILRRLKRDVATELPPKVLPCTVMSLIA
jgi:hypothetical protein